MFANQTMSYALKADSVDKSPPIILNYKNVSDVTIFDELIMYYKVCF